MVVRGWCLTPLSTCCLAPVRHGKCLHGVLSQRSGHVLVGITAFWCVQKSRLGSTLDAERVLTEIRCFMELTHPNIIKLLQVVDQEKSVVLVLEYAAGGDLHNHLKVWRCSVQ